MSAPSRSLLLLCCSGCVGPGMVCGDGVEGLDLTDPAGGFLYTRDAVPIFTVDVDADFVDDLPTTGAYEDEPDVPATFGFGEEAWRVGLHLRGHDSFRPFDEKPGLKIDFHEWMEDQRFHGVKHLTLANMVQDASMLSESLAYTAYDMLGLPAPRHGYACLVVNGEDRGLYGVVETMDDQFVERAFEETDGNLYEGSFGDELIVGGTADYEDQSIDDVTDHSDLRALAIAMDGTTPDTLLSAFDAWFDLDSLLDAWAVELVVGDIDGYLTRGNNYVLYHEPDRDRWWFVPWGADQCFDEDVDVIDPEYEGDEETWHGVLYEKCTAAPDCAAAMEEHLGGVLDRLDEQDLAGLAVSESGRIGAMSRADPMAAFGPAEGTAARRRTAAYIRGRRGDIQRQLE